MSTHMSTDRVLHLRDFLPYTLDIAHFSLDTQFTLCTDFECDLLDFLGEDRQLSNHVVDSVDKA
jgi:hypothetical protein